MSTTALCNTLLIIMMGYSQLVYAQATELPLIQIEALEYQGAFSIPGDEYGESNANYSAGIITLNSAQNSLFIAGHNVHGAIAEFSIPELVNSTLLAELNSATVLQDFRRILDETPDSNPQALDRVTGMYVQDNKLIVNALEFYDAPANNTHTSLVIEDASELTTSEVSGYYSLEGAAHASAWISEIPTEWQGLLGGTHLTGNSSKYSINSRLPMGVSAFSFDPYDLTEPTASMIPTTTLMDFDLDHPLYVDFENYYDANYNIVELFGSTFPLHTVEDADIVAGENNLWTEDSEVTHGFIVPGTRTYLCLGSSGGHNSGIGYKATQSDGNGCGGPCPYDANDVYNYFWLWDVNDLLEVKNGTLLPHDVRPYAYGEFEVPFQYDEYYQGEEFHKIIGGTYDSEANLLYLAIDDGASTGAYDRRPVIAAYGISNTVCAGDLNSDNQVDVVDFLILNSAFGTACAECSADITGDGFVDVEDFVMFNSLFGSACN